MVDIRLAASCYGYREKLQPDRPLGSNANFTFCYGIFVALLKLIDSQFSWLNDIG